MNPMPFDNTTVTVDHARWFRETGLIETLWILDNRHYIWRQNCGFPGTYKDIVIKRKKL